MDLFIILFQEPIPPETVEIVKSPPLGNEVFRLSDRALLVRSYVDNPKVLSDLTGMSSESESPPVGVVFKLNGSYHGYYHKDLWDWLAENR